ncbi:MAG: DUF2063 domain-containing protein [Thiohalomonadales bacterium]
MKNPTLKEIQGQFKSYLFSGENQAQLLACIADRNHISAQRRLQVYQNAYYIRLQEAIAHDFPALLAVAGEARFAQLAKLYIQDHPSRAPSLRDFAEALPTWLRLKGESVLTDIASLEWAVVTAFDAADSESITSAQLAVIPPQQWQSLHLRFHPGLHFLDVNCNAKDIWSAVRNEDTVPALTSGNPVHLVIWRAQQGPTVQALDAVEYQLLSSLKQGDNFGQCCLALSQEIATERIPELSARILAMAVNSGWVVGLSSDGGPIENFS